MACAQECQPFEFELNFRAVGRVARRPGEDRPELVLRFAFLSIDLLRLRAQDCEERRKRVTIGAGGVAFRIAAAVRVCSDCEGRCLFGRLRTTGAQDTGRDVRLDVRDQFGHRFERIGRRGDGFTERLGNRGADEPPDVQGENRHGLCTSPLQMPG